MHLQQIHLGILASGGGGKKWLVNTRNMQDSIKALGTTEYDFLFIMDAYSQEAGQQEPGFPLAISYVTVNLEKVLK